MSNKLQQMMQVNIKGRAFVICQSRGVSDPSIISYYVQILEEATMAMLSDDSSITDFHAALNEQAAWLEREIDQLNEAGPAVDEASSTSDNPIDDGEEKQEKQPKPERDHKKESGYVPDAKSMPERLKDRRAEMEHLLANDCVTLKLVTPKQAKKYVQGLVGRDPKKAEADLVAELRNALHQHVVSFIRKNNGGPWNSATEQTEIRMQIAKTKSLQALVNLSKVLLSEREEWVRKSKKSLVGRLFGGRVKLD
ncbi:MAG: hypothetical protein ABW104_11175 [Candidatus Thiodiazotropha sp. 6PLUC2]